MDAPQDDDPARPDLEALTQAAASGDDAAMAQLLERHQDELHAFVRLRYGKLLAARESSSDLVQSVCREVLEHADRFRHPEPSAFRRWLFVTAMRKIKNRQAYYLAGRRDVLREKTPSARDDDSGLEEAWMQHYCTFSTPSAAVGMREEVARVEEAFEALTDEQREVLTLAHLAGMSRKEIGEHLGKSEGAVRVILHRALAKLSTKLGAEKS